MSKTNKTSGNNTAIIIIAILLVAVIVCGIITHGFKDWSACGCFGHKYGEDGICTRCGEEKSEDDKVEKKTNDNAVITPGKSHNMVVASAKILYSAYEEEGISAQAESAYRLTATLEPEDVTNNKVDWTVAYADGTTSGVTSYVTVTPTSDGSLTANVECKQAFSKQIVVTVTSRENSEIKASCTVDYRKRAVSSMFYITKDFSGGPVNNAVYYATADEKGVITAQKSNGIKFDFTTSSPSWYVYSSVTYGVGTLDCEDEVTLSCKLNANLNHYLGQAGAHSGGTVVGCSNNTCTHAVDVNNPKTVVLKTGGGNANVTFDAAFLAKFTLYTGGTSTVQIQKFNNLRMAFDSINRGSNVNATAGDFDFIITCGDYSQTYVLDVDISTVAVKATSVSLSEGSLIF